MNTGLEGGNSYSYDDDEEDDMMADEELQQFERESGSSENYGLPGRFGSAFTHPYPVATIEKESNIKDVVKKDNFLYFVRKDCEMPLEE